MRKSIAKAGQLGEASDLVIGEALHRVHARAKRMFGT